MTQPAAQPIDPTEDRLRIFDAIVSDLGAPSSNGMVIFDPRAPGVTVPDRLAKQSMASLAFSFRQRVADFAYDSEGVRGTLSFGSDGHRFCNVPWSAVCAIADPTWSFGGVWPEKWPKDGPPPVQILAGFNAEVHKPDYLGKPAEA